jgi:hypothetical protein
MKEAFIIKLNDDGKTLRVNWQYYGSLMSIGSSVGKNINSKHPFYRELIGIATRLKEMALDNPITDIKVEEVKRKTQKEKKPVQKKKAEKVQIKPRRKKGGK